ncbi:hypothetical protein WH52_04390 [Tenacibaculum holothuriorum]|uniref:Uncharacterized protein n=1 Tax=Tenacibaculum holothuriorum TaxID=1635173 RepID=A0A1Y2PGV0_9FLAO|nr:hypothetical protein [Tenacibaculum holothuriorum]OSY88908.1 hypothetical protein WH52_04390 [Tenacibaculum holothuriorum]
MMQLTKEQIQQIEWYLDRKRLQYIDVRIEVLDHVISEIEQATNTVSFEKAFEKVKFKWNKLLEEDSSVYLGYAYVKPKVVVEKLKKYGKPHAIKIWSVFAIMLLLLNFKQEVSFKGIQILNFMAQVWIYISAALILVGGFLIRKSKIKTSYSFLYNSQVLPYILFPFMLFGSFLTQSGGLDIFEIAMLLFSLFVCQLGIKLYKRHFLTVKKYSLKCS